MLATLLLLALSVVTPTDWATIIKPVMKQVPRLEILKEGADHPAICSGVVINREKGFVLTAAHCVEGFPRVSVTVAGRAADVIRVNVLLDLAVVRFNAKSEQEITMAAETPPTGSEVAIVGYNFGMEQIAVQFGRVSQPLNKETKTLWIDGTIIPGQSGGAVIDTEGKLIGITSRIYYNGPANIGAAIPIEQIDDFVAPYLPKK